MTVGERCPRCGSDALRGGKQDLPGGDTLYDYFCTRCGLLEDRLRSDPDFDAWKRRWQAAALGRRALADAIADDHGRADRYRALLGLAHVRCPGEPDGAGGWSPAALALRGRAELWVFTDDDAVTACQREVGATRLGPIAPPRPFAPLVAMLPPDLPIWINPLDPAGGLVLEGDRRHEARRWADVLVREEAIRAGGAAALYAADDVTVALVDGQLASETDAAGEWIAVFTADDAQTAYLPRVRRGDNVAFLHMSGADLRARLSDLRTTRPRLAGCIINPAGPTALARLPL